ncbi:MAG TPA: sulfotransferase [Allosphingosinicella sp.]
MNGISDRIGQALLLQRSGNLSAARKEAERALADHPDSPDLLQLLGMITCQLGDLGEGAALLRRALELEPAKVATRQALATALLALGRADEAEALCRPAGDQPPDTALLRLRGYILQTQERFAEAAECYAGVVERDPGDWEILNNLGNARRSAGDLQGAVEALEQARLVKPDAPAIQFNLATAFAQTGRLEEAALAFGEVLRLVPDSGPALLELARALRFLGRFDEALRHLTRLEQVGEATAETAMERARTLSALGRFEEAEAAFRHALAYQQGRAEAFLELGLLFERHNKTERLAGLLDEADQHGVEPEALSHLRALALEREGRIEQALEAAQSAPPGDEPGRRAALIGRLADKARRPEIAFEAYAEMNRVTTESNPEAKAEAAAYREHIGALGAMLTPEFGASWRRDESPPDGRPPPIFLVGFPRSGTTLLDTMLMGHPALHVLEEVPILEKAGLALGDFARLPELDAEETRRLRAVYFEALDEAEPSARERIVVDKLPLNIAGAPLIHRLFPDARLIFALRHPCDVVLSCFMQGFDLNPAMANFLDLEQSALLYDRIMTVWTRTRDLLPLDVHTIRYETLVENAEGQLRPLIDYLGLEWDEQVLDHRGTAGKRGAIMTPSYAQVAEPIYKRASGRWERYRAQMEPVLPILAPWAKRFGYETALAGGYFLGE